MKNILSIGVSICLSFVAIAQSNISKLEYYFDTDPGMGNATSITITPAPIANISYNLDLTGLQGGMHIANIRALNDSGWSLTYSQPFVVLLGAAAANVTDLEYFIDTDPGLGNATQVTLSSPGPSAIENFMVNLTGLTGGLHILHVRTKDANNLWSLTYSQPFLVSTAGAANPIVELEYFIDTDPGFGSATPLTVATPAPAINESFVLSLSGIPSGLHILHLRAKDSNGAWSLVYNQPFLVNAVGSIDQIASLEYFIDTDPGYGNGTPISVSPATALSVNDIVSLSGVSDGLHILHVRGQTVAGNWTLNTVKPFIVIGGGVNPTIVALEYHIDSVSALGQGTSIPLTPATVIDSTVTVDLTLVSEGTHRLYVAAKDANGNWSLVNNRQFCVGGLALFTSDTSCVGTPTLIWNTSPSDTTGISFDWDVDNDSITDFTSKDTIEYTFPSIGSFPVTLIVDKDSLCPDTFTTTVVVDSLGTISGNVFNSFGVINSGFAKLYKVVSGAYIKKDSVAISPTGTYTFINVIPDIYVIKAFPNKTIYPNTVSTYFDSTYHWANATVINSFCDTTIDIGLLDLSLVFGDGTISGNIYWADTTGQRAGDPIPGVDISIEQIPGGIIASQGETDANGHYVFSNLPDATYQVYVDIPGAPMDSTYTVTINSTDTLYTNLNFVFDSASIYILQQTGTLIESSKALNYTFEAYPNPFNENITAKLALPSNGNVTIILTDVLGNNLKTINDSYLSEGEYLFEIQSLSTNYASGVYFLNISINGYASSTIRLLKTK